MGGKTKQNQRTKNNAKPSNSGRSAELLGASVPSFVGFSAHSDLGMVPFAPGFANTENLPETFDSSISTQFQLVLRKMSKKDPVTKVKALQEFIELITESEVDVVKGILPLWPKFYHNLANDADHRVRESSQNVQSLIVMKCKKAVAPYLKQLTPVWLASQFDNYPPAASIAYSSLQSVFVANKMQEVCLFCQQEILDYAVRNLTFHTASTLSSTKSCTAEEAEHKYQRVVACSLKMVSFFLERTDGGDISGSIEKIHDLLKHQKFWSFAKHRTVNIKSSWFELLYNVLQHTPQLTEDIRGQLISTCFQNIDESDPLTVPHVWGCILLLQNAHEDWYKSINMKKQVQPKLSTFLRNACNGNAESVCPNLLPFLSGITQECLQDVSLETFYTDFFKDLKEAITSSTISKSDLSFLATAYYECIRFILKRLISINVLPTDDVPPGSLPQLVLDEFINHTLRWALHMERVGSKCIFTHTSALVAYWADNADSPLYSYLLKGFWSALTEDVKKTSLYKQYLENVIELINCLYVANPNISTSRVSFLTNDDTDATDGAGRQKVRSTRLYVQIDLRKLAVLLVRQCLACVSEHKTLHYESQMQQLMKLYGDPEFYAEISSKNDMEVTLNELADLLSSSPFGPSEIILEIVFEILNFMEKERKLQFINNLLETKKTALQQCLLQRLLSYPMCIEPEVRDMLCQDHVVEIILQTANEVLVDDSKEKFNLLHKCFFQTDSGEILINQKAVDGILDIISRPLTNPEEYDSMMDSCGSFIAQIMPVVCSENSSEKAQRDIFIKLFKFTINQKKSEELSEDTLWEVSTCWQDALSSEDIKIDYEMLQKCSEIVSNRVAIGIEQSEMEYIAECMSRLIMCSTENLSEDDERYQCIDKYMEVMFKPTKESYNETFGTLCRFCAYLEVVQGGLSVLDLPDDAGKDVDFRIFFERSLLNLSALIKMVCAVNITRVLANIESPDELEYTEDFIDTTNSLLYKWSEKVYDLLYELVKVAALGEHLVRNIPKVSKDQLSVMLEISEKIKVLLRISAEEHTMKIKDRLLKNALLNDVAAIRALPYLVCMVPYSEFQDSALILLKENLAEYFITRGAPGTFVNFLQFIYHDLSPKALTADSPILKGESDVWHKCVFYRLMSGNHFGVDVNDIADKDVLTDALNFITEVSESQKDTEKEKLLFNTDVAQQDFLTVTRTVEYINVLGEVVRRFPYDLTIKHWDAIRIGLSSWVLSVSKSMEHYTQPKVSIFVATVYNLFAGLAGFIKRDKAQASSTDIVKNMVDEWENLFAPEVNLVLFKNFYKFATCKQAKGYSESYRVMFKEISSSVQKLDYSIIYKFCKTGKQITLDDLIKFLMENVSSPMHNLRVVSVHILLQLQDNFIAADKEALEKTTDIVDTKTSESGPLAKWHFMYKFEEHMKKYEAGIVKYLDDFSFKLTELPDLKPISRDDALPYMFVWECILNVCSKAPVELRSVYTAWITENKFDQKFLNFLFRAMPVEILKNHDSKIMSNELFKGLKWERLNDENLPVDKYACHLYSRALCNLPAVVRKWWNGSHARQKVFVDKLTTNFVSGIICLHELETIGEINIKEKHNNMQVTVHVSTREVIAVYSIDEARMELVITLAPNYPLGGVKVESGKQIGGRTSSRNIAMQLTIFLTHQNGSIFDGLSLWKKNLDKKFEGVEECYVCYTVIHQDTCQLPKLTCKTCRKKFHSPCLYKWFTTSSKSTCPICRNIF